MRAGMWFFTAFMSVFYLVGFGLLGYGLWSMRRSTESGTWPMVTGTIDACELTTHPGGADSDPTHKVEVKYTYSVNGRQYTGDTLAFGYTSSSGREVHKEILARLQAAQTVEVRYDPFDPQTSVLSYGVHRSIQFTIAFAITWLLFVVGFTVIWWVAAQSDTVLLENLITQ
jgi:hypothetical protein